MLEDPSGTELTIFDEISSDQETYSQSLFYKYFSPIINESLQASELADSKEERVENKFYSKKDLRKKRLSS